MKTEDFDKALRDKLNSINHTYSNSDIDKVFRHVKKNRRLTWKGLKGSWIFYSLSAAAMVVISTTVLYKMPLGTSVKKHEVTSAVSNAGKVQDNIVIADSIVEKRNPEADSTQINSGMAAQPAPVATVKHESFIQPDMAANRSTKRGTGSHNPENKTPIANTEPGEMTTVAAVTSVNNVPVEQKSDPVKNTVSAEVPRTENEITQAAEIPKAPPVQPPALQADVSNPGVALKATDTQKQDSANFQPEMVQKSDSGSVDPKKISVLPGISFNVSNQRIGTGLSVDVTFGKHVGITTGLTYNFLYEQQFPDRETMHGGPPHGYNPHLNDHFGDKNHVSDIRIQNQLLQLPVAINYQVPLKHNFTLGFSLGTELDLYLYQKVSYTRHLDSMRTDSPHFGSRGTVVPFNSMFFGVGASKQWNHLQLNIQPYYNQRIKDLFYKPGEAEFGVGIKLMYVIGK